MIFINPVQGSVKLERVEIFEENTTRSLTGSYTECEIIYLRGVKYMAIAERIKFFRNLRGMTQKFLGMSVGFSERTADIRMAQYESGTRTPKSDLTNSLASALQVSPAALNVPDIENYNGIMHTLFAMEDLYGLRIDKLDGEVCIRLDKDNGTEYITMTEMFRAWETQAEKFRSGEISKEEYDEWRYNYPRNEVKKVRMSHAKR